MPAFRRLLAAALVVGACVLLAPGVSGAAAAPCSCTAAGTGTSSGSPSGSPTGGPTDNPTDNPTGMVRDHVRAASAVFTGTVEEITAPGGTTDNGSSRTSTVRVNRVYKGEMITTETVDVVTTRTFADCAGAELMKGETYVFFVESDEGFTAVGCGGTTRANTRLITQVEGLLGAGREPVPPAPPTATMNPVNTDDPTSLSRVAAPGLALVIIGLLGLAVVRRLARPRP